MSTKTVLITGASSGLGRATAKLFQRNGWNVIATMRNPSQEMELSQLERTLVTRLDVQDLASIQQAVDSGIARFGAIDALINNAGYGAYGPLETTSIESMRRQFDVNVLGVLATTQALLPHFRAARAGTIVNVSSVGGRVAFPLGALYHGSKYALEGISEALQYELHGLGVRIKLVEPGGIKTGFSTALDLSNDPQIAEYQPLVSSVLGVFGKLMESGSPAEKIAEAVYLATIDSSPQLRHIAGADAEELLGSRAALDDEAFSAGMRATFAIA